MPIKYAAQGRIPVFTPLEKAPDSRRGYKSEVSAGGLMPPAFPAKRPVSLTGFTGVCLIFLLSSPFVLAQDRRAFNFAVMGCAHMGVCESKDYALAVAKIKAQKPDFVVFLGGMVDVPPGGDVDSVWRKFDSITARLGTPVYDVPGSCLWGPLSVDRGKAERSEKCFIDRYKKRYYSFEHKNNLFVGLDSDSPDRPGTAENGMLSAEQLEFLKKTLMGAQKFDNIFVFLHDSRWMRENGLKWSAGLSPAVITKIKYVFSAKEHFFHAENADGVTYITTGSPPCALRRASYPVLFHFLTVSVNGENATVNVAPLKSIPLENMMSGEDRKGEKGGTDRKEGRGRRGVQNYQLNEPVMMDSIERKAMLPIGPIIKALNIRPGMQIADVGAGVGVFTFPLAEALKETGMVFATETDMKMIQALRRDIDRKKYKNIFPVGVSAEGVDPFYKGRTFDIMLFVELYHYLWHPADYFRELRPSLTKETGRLYIIHFKQLPDFNEIEFDDFKETLETLKAFTSSPLFLKLGAGIESFVRNWRGNNVPPAVREKIVRNFNSALADPGLFNDMLTLPRRPGDGDSSERGKTLLKMLFPRNLELARWLIVELESERVFEKKTEQLTDREKNYLRRLNKALLTGAFKMDKLDYLKGAYPLYAEKEHIISEMEAAGYRFVREHAFLNYHYFLEFK